ncbi:M23 family metallopeptidase [Alicyclobacillus acidiphilus]|uniref:M23 family metallopeptidase n=1 Tax=Alicyclobacillus acidiphilus TaxID=182455 RepID=UPI00082B84EC|nr:M23 family metallopeptidase [Alicyclobacillus acidiphilus]
MASVKRKWPWQVGKARHPELKAAADPFTTRAVDESEAPVGPARWVGESGTDPSRDGSSVVSNLSPYGFAEDDASMRQVEGEVWRRPIDVETSRSASARRRFVATTNGGRSKEPHSNPSSKSTHFVVQLFFAAVLVGVGYFVSHDPRVPQTVASDAQSVFATDYTEDVQPTIDHWFAKLHIAQPVFNVATTSLHEPIHGTIVDDYGVNHPEIWLSGNANQTVQAAGSGTVITVVKSGNSDLVKLDNGAVGTTIYDGLGSVNVKVNEYVNAGESIGRLPSSPSHPILRFSVVKDGKYENPHDLIRFSGSSS